ncbi:copper homeostasis protein CutC [Bacteroidia bacterium]|nr:copper homeostasis protein CutC [Bacteroidia bacterium]
MPLEICTDSFAGAQIAQIAGAHRIELCTGLSEGGMTPSSALISKVRENMAIPVYILIRPRSGDFLYSHAEFEIMKTDIHHCGQCGCDGVVIGMLLPDGQVDIEHCRELVQIAQAYSMGVTFHRAFDRSNDLFHALEEVIHTGCERILTSGGYNTAIEGVEVLRQLIKQAGKRIIIMPGAGVTPENAETLIQTTGLRELHGTFRSFYPSKMQYRNEKLGHRESEYTTGLPDAEKIKKILHLLP